ncbi:MAG: alkanesulfonate monooxygenase SsuD, partial [Rhodothermales bacterium]
NVHGFLADDAKAAGDLAYGPTAQTMNRIGRERGWAPMTRAHFDHEAGPDGAIFLGNPEQVAEKILRQHRVFGHDRTLIQLSVGTIPRPQMLRAIELFGTKVAPMVRKELAG